jgi:maltose/moltooligosaccharide transporter
MAHNPTLVSEADASKPTLSFWQIWNMCFGFFGIQFGWGLQLANMSAIYTQLKANPEEIPLLWLAGPVTGLLVQPIIGSMSDRTWSKFGRRRPYFFIGAVFSSIALFFMPMSSSLWMAAGLLWILDASINVSMEPFRAFVADKLNVNQRTAGFVMQSFFIGVGQTFANALPFILRKMGVEGTTESGISLTTMYAFQVGAVIFFLSVIYTCFTTGEYPPENMEVFLKEKEESKGVGAFFAELISSLGAMPATMKQLAVVQVFTWLGLFCMWMFFGLTTAYHVFGASDSTSDLFREGSEWNGLNFAVYSIVCFVVAFYLPKLAEKTSQKTVHTYALICGAVGLISVIFIKDKYVLWLSMVGVGIAWASILSMPYAMLSNALPQNKMGVYMGIFNFFIVIPEIVASLGLRPVIVAFFGENSIHAPLYVVVGGGVSLLIAAFMMRFVKE